MFTKYYQSELSYLREIGREFAQAYPSVAGLLAERSGDPDVERLLEGFSFLSAKIHQRIDDALPALVQNLCELLIPQYIRPVPATTIVEFDPDLSSLRGIRAIERGALLSSTPIHGTSCTFKTCFDVELLPLEIVDAQLDRRIAAKPCVKINFSTNEAGRSVVTRPAGFRLYIHGDSGLAANLLLWFVHHCTGIVVRNSSGEEIAQLPPECIHHFGYQNDALLFDWPPLSNDGFRFVQEYFTLPEKFRFIEIRGLDRFTLQEDTFELSFEMKRPPDLPAGINASTFRLHCTPAINLFEISADPISLDPLVPRYLIRAGGIDPGHMEIAEITSIVGIRDGHRERTSYQPFFRYRHNQDSRTRVPHYVIDRTSSPVDNGIDTYLAISDSDIRDSDERETLSIELVCTNRFLPEELKIGDIQLPARGSTLTNSFSNITPVTMPNRTPLDGSLHWKLLAHLALNRQNISHKEALISLLHLYNFQGELATPTGKSNELQIDAIRSISTAAITRLIHGGPVRGTQTTIELDEAGFGSIGNLWLFASILNELFASHVGINSFNELAVTTHPSKTEFRWTAKNGTMAII